MQGLNCAFLHLLINTYNNIFATQAVAGLPLSFAKRKGRKKRKGLRPLTPLRRGWAPTKTARTKSISTVGSISLKMSTNSPALKQCRRFAAASGDRSAYAGSVV
jgi:hypothetical protein